MAFAAALAGGPETRVQRGRSRRLLGISLVLDGTVAFRRTSDVLVPVLGGVYLIHDLRGVLYVGLSRDLRRRFQEHEGQPTNPLIAEARANALGPISFSWISVRDTLRRAAVEAELIAAFDPPCNRCAPALRTSK